MYREELPLFRWLTSWLPRLLVAGSFTLAACDAGDTTAPDTADPPVSPAKGPTGQACVGCPVVSSHILFSTLVGGKNDIWVMNPDRSGRRAIFTSPADDYDPSWSPSSSRFVFVRNHIGPIASTINGLWTVGYDGLGAFRVTDNYGDRGPAWSKTNRIAFYSDRLTSASATNEIFSINPDGTGLTRLTNNLADDRDPAWSPNGTKIVFASNRGLRRVGPMHLYVMNADGTGVNQLTYGSGEDQPAWSPDGTKIAYHVKDGLYTVNADGSNAGRLVASIADDGITLYFRGQPAWAPDGKTLASVTNSAGPYQIQSISYPDLGFGRLLTPQDQYPAWN